MTVLSNYFSEVYFQEAKTSMRQTSGDSLPIITSSQSASSLKVIQKSTFVLSRYAPIRRGERPVWASSPPDSFNNVMACSELLAVFASNTTWTAQNAEGE